MASVDSKPRTWPVATVLGLSCLAAVLAVVWSAQRYGGIALWPGLVGNFVASLLAFVLALSWERTRERVQQAEADAEAEMEREAREVELGELRTTEARRRLEPVREELRRNKRSLEFLTERYNEEGVLLRNQLLHPELLDGAWAANSTRLAALLADYGLISDLASSFGRIEELRWRLRQRTTTMAVMAGNLVAQNLIRGIDEISRPLEA